MGLCTRGHRRCGLVDERHGRKDLYSFGTRETSSGNIPTCCLWLDLIPLMVEVADEAAPLLVVLGLPVLSKLCLLVRLVPPYKGGGGRLTGRVLLGLG